MGFGVIHGLRSVYPIAIAEACSFDDALFEETTRREQEKLAGKEQPTQNFVQGDLKTALISKALCKLRSTDFYSGKIRGDGV